MTVSKQLGAPNGGRKTRARPACVCVIGAGVCGIVATKICLEAGLHVTCYEKSDKYGGLWNYRPGEPESSASFEPSVMKTTVLNTSKELSAFSDFPPPATLPNFMRHNQYMDYIRRYVDHFKLLPAIHFEHEILACQLEWETKSTEQKPVVKWAVSVKNLKTNEVSEQRFDKLMVAVGHHKIPFQSAQQQFEGEALHQLGLRRSNEFDLFLNIFAPHLSIPDQRKHKQAPQSEQVGEANQGQNKQRLATFEDNPPVKMTIKNTNCTNCIGCFNCNSCRNCDDCRNCNNSEFLSGSKNCNSCTNCHNCGNCNGSRDCYNCKNCNSCTNCKNAKNLNGQSNVGVDSNTTCEAGPAQLAVIKSLAFIGLVQPNGSITVISELQARYAVLVFKNQLELPSFKWMFKHMEQTRKMRATSIRSHSRDQLIGSYVNYTETLARLMGVRPNLFKLFFTDHKLWRQLIFGPCVPYQYRLTGPGYWNGAREAILFSPVRANSGIDDSDIATIG